MTNEIHEKLTATSSLYLIIYSFFSFSPLSIHKHLPMLKSVVKNFLFLFILSSLHSHHFISRSCFLICSGKRHFKCLAGTPATISYGCTSFVTTAPAPMMLPFPIVIIDNVDESLCINPILTKICTLASH